MSDKMKVFWGVLAICAVLLVILAVYELAKGILKTVGTIILVLLGVAAVVILIRVIMRVLRK